MLAWPLAVAVAPVVPWHGQPSSSVQARATALPASAGTMLPLQKRPFEEGAVGLSTSFVMQYLFLLGDGFL